MATTDELAWAPAWRLRELTGARSISAEDLVRGCLDRIAALDDTLRAFITVAADRALQQARRADDRAAAGEPLGLLHGVPVALKDEAWTEGIASSGGSELFQDFVPTEDGDIARRLTAAGAVIVGKTNMPEFAAWPRSLSRMAGESVNPYDTSRTSGASSGGSAAALAAGLVPIAVGSDGGGSIRIPSSHCGVVGLFPTPGLVPDGGSFSYSPYASLGPMARDVRDVATLLHVLTHDPSGAGDETAPGLLPDGEVRGLRVGFSPDFGFIPVMPGIVQLVREGLESLQRAGVTVDDVDVRLEPYFEMFAVATSGYGRFRADERPIPYVRTTEFEERCRQPENFEKLCAYTQFAMSQPAPTAEQYSGALAYREQLVAQFDALFARYDILVSPTMHVTAPAVDDGWDTPYPDAWMGTPFTAVGNLLRLTAASYPVGLLDGLPVGLQVIGRSGDEARVLQVCRALEIARPWTARPPIAG